MKKSAPQWEKDGFVMRLAEPKDALVYYQQNFCPLDKEVARFTGCKTEFTQEEVVGFFLQCMEADDRYDFLLISPEGQIVGESVLNEIDWKTRCANFRICIFQPEARGKGFGYWMTYVTRDFAFETLNLNRVELDVFSFNIRAQRTYIAAGFRKEGVRRQAILDGDTYGDDILMAILKSEWEKSRKGESYVSDHTTGRSLVTGRYKDESRSMG